MGFFKSLNTLTKQAKEIDKAAGPMDQRLDSAMAQMQQAQAFMAQQTAASQAAVDPAAIKGQAQVVAVRDTGARVNLDPTLDIDLLVTLPGQPPYPVTTRAVVSMAHLGRLTPGGQVQVRVNPATPQLVHLDFTWV
jgi:hypothetical protein